MLLLSLGSAGPSASLVQGRALSLPRRERPARRARRFRRYPAAGNRDPGMGLDSGDAFPGAADAAQRRRGLERAATRRARDAGLDDRHRISEYASRPLVNGVPDMVGLAAL